MITFGELIFTERVRRNLSLREAAARIGISHTYLASLERDCDPRTGNPLTPSPDVLLKLCNAYGLAYGELAHYFTFVNENDMLLFIVRQLRALRKKNKKRYLEIMAEIELG